MPNGLSHNDETPSIRFTISIIAVILIITGIGVSFIIFTPQRYDMDLLVTDVQKLDGYYYAVGEDKAIQIGPKDFLLTKKGEMNTFSCFGSIPICNLILP